MNLVRERRMRIRKPAKGIVKGSKHRKICVTFETDMFDRIEDYITESRLSSFGEGIRTLVAYAFDMLRHEDQPDLFDYDAINLASLIAHGVLRGEL